MFYHIDRPPYQGFSLIITRVIDKSHKNSSTWLSIYASRKYYGNVIYGAAKASGDKMSMDMAIELKPHNIACVSLYPGYIDDNKNKKKPNAKKESSHIGRAIANLASDENIMSKTGQILIAAELGKEYGFKDIDGTQPEPYDTL